MENERVQLKILVSPEHKRVMTGIAEIRKVSLNSLMTELINDFIEREQRNNVFELYKAGVFEFRGVIRE